MLHFTKKCTVVMASPVGSTDRTAWRIEVATSHWRTNAKLSYPSVIIVIITVNQESYGAEHENCVKHTFRSGATERVFGSLGSRNHCRRLAVGGESKLDICGFPNLV